MAQHIINRLYKILLQRKNADPDKSYVAKLCSQGTRKIAKKIGEEAAELIIDAIILEGKPDGKKARSRVESESADLLFHMLVLWANHDIKPDAVFKILEDRMGVSGLEEKARRRA